MTFASLPPTPSETPPTHSPEMSLSSLDAQPGSSPTHSSSWGTPSPEPEEQTGSGSPDLSPHLAHFMLKWDIREARLEDLQRPQWFQEQAFSSARTRCTLVFQVGGTEPWAVEDLRRADGRALTVADVVSAVDEWLWAAVGDDAFYRHPRLDEAVNERSYRLLGPEDGLSNTFRNVDRFVEDRSFFRGLDEVVGKNNASTLFFRVGLEPRV